MLKEIQSNAFIKNGQIRDKIVFHEGLNVIKGTNSGSNSIGKSTFLMCLDFAFGGDDYVDKLTDVQTNVGIHDINFAYEFEGKMYYFCRSTGNPKIVNVCDQNYNKTRETMESKDFLQFLHDKYVITNSLSFRGAVSRYFRIYNRENLDEQLPLRMYKDEPMKKSIESVIKLFNLYGPVEVISDRAQEAADMKTTFTDAQKYDYIPKITKTKFNENLKRIDELSKAKLELADKSEKGLLELDAQKADALISVQNELKVYKRQRSKLYNQLDSIKSDKKEEQFGFSSSIKELSEYFDNVNIKALEEIESFHSGLKSILLSELRESEQKTWALINFLNEKIAFLEKKITDLHGTSNISKVVLDQYASVDRELDQLQKENEYFNKLAALSEDSSKKKESLTKSLMEQASTLQANVNAKMRSLNAFIFGESINTPKLTIVSPSTYTFYTPNDNGTGTNYKGMVIFDLASLELTEIPAIIHDSVLLKQISNESLEKIFELYEQTKKQVFVAIDKETSYTQKTSDIISSNEVLYLSPNGNELFGRDWGRNKE